MTISLPWQGTINITIKPTPVKNPNVIEKFNLRGIIYCAIGKLTSFRSLQNLHTLGLFDKANQAKFVFLSVEIGSITAIVASRDFANDSRRSRGGYESGKFAGKAVGAVDGGGGRDAGCACDRR